MGNTLTAPTTPTGGNGCNIVAEIDCLILKDDGFPLYECDDLPDPRTVTCTNANPATGLAFRYLGGDSFPEKVYVTVAGGRTGDVFAGVVSMNEIFEANGDFRGEAVIDISTVDATSAAAGTLLETLSIDTYCDTMSKLTLTTMFGPLELTGFTNAVGKLSSIRTVRVEYFIGNDSSQPMDAADAAITSALQDRPFSALDSPMRLEGNEQSLVWPFSMDLYKSIYTETGTVDFGEMFKSGNLFSFSMEAAGRSDSGAECTDNAQFGF